MDFSYLIVHVYAQAHSSNELLHDLSTTSSGPIEFQMCWGLCERLSQDTYWKNSPNSSLFVWRSGQPVWRHRWNIQGKSESPMQILGSQFGVRSTENFPVICQTPQHKDFYNMCVILRSNCYLFLASTWTWLKHGYSWQYGSLAGL